MDPTRDAALVEAVRRGDEGAFARLYAAHHPPLYRYAVNMCGAAAADDVVQDTFLAVLRDPRRFDPGRGTLATYLFGIARHHILKRLAVARLEVPMEEDGEPGSESPSPFDDMSRTEIVDVVRAAIRSLPPVYREVIVLCELEELDYATASRVIDSPIGTVRSRLHRARALLTAKLAAGRVPVVAQRGMK